jgi:outer membrane protein assembly factor BamB
MTRQIAAVLCLAMPAFSPAADWARFRGPDGTGTTKDSVPVTWDESTTRWTAELPGRGMGSPIVVKGKVYLQSATADGTKRHLVCYDATTGKQDWLTTLPGQSAKIHAKNSLASSTPACDGERIYCVFWDGDGLALHGFDLTGQELWKKTLGGFKSQHGAGASPMVTNGKVYVNYDQDDAAEVVAFDAKTGDKAWSASRKAFRACYSTPFLRPRADGGKADLVVTSTAGLTGYDPDTGAVTWNWVWKFDGMALRTVASPVPAGNLIVQVAGDGGGSRHTVVIDPEASKQTKPMLWEKKKDSPYVPGPVVHGEHIYWVTDAGHTMCVELKTGKVIWKDSTFPKPVSASLILTQSASPVPLILALSETGQAVFYKASPAGFDKVAENDLNEPVFATPAVSDGRLIIRAGTKLLCVSQPAG